MSMGIYFSANRTGQMTPDEDRKIEEISQKYMEEYKGKEYEGPGCIIGKEGKPIFSGFIRIPFSFSPKGLEKFLNYWLKWLTEITYVLAGAEWEVSLEEVPLLWDEGSGWRLMTDEEYNKEFH